MPPACLRGFAFPSRFSALRRGVFKGGEAEIYGGALLIMVGYTFVSASQCRARSPLLGSDMIV